MSIYADTTLNSSKFTEEIHVFSAGEDDVDDHLAYGDGVADESEYGEDPLLSLLKKEVCGYEYGISELEKNERIVPVQLTSESEHASSSSVSPESQEDGNYDIYDVVITSRKEKEFFFHMCESYGKHGRKKVLPHLVARQEAKKASLK